MRIRVSGLLLSVIAGCVFPLMAISDDLGAPATTDLATFSDDVLGTSVGVVSTNRDYLTFVAIVLKLIKTLGADEEWGPRVQADYLLVAALEDVGAGRPIPSFLEKIETDAVLEALSQIKAVESSCEFSIYYTSSRERVLVVLVSLDSHGLVQARHCTLLAFGAWLEWNEPSASRESTRSRLIDLLSD